MLGEYFLCLLHLALRQALLYLRFVGDHLQRIDVIRESVENPIAGGGDGLDQGISLACDGLNMLVLVQIYVIDAQLLLVLDYQIGLDELDVVDSLRLYEDG